MVQFFKDIWYGEPMRVFGLLSSAGTAYVGFGDPPVAVVGAVVVVNAIAGFYGFRQLTTPEYPDKVSAKTKN